MSKKEYLFDYYKNTVDTYKTKYPNQKIVVLMQVGSFYEIYDSGNYNIIDMDDISSILNMIITKKDKNNPETNERNHLLIGFPCVSLQKYIPKLLDNSYIIVILDQRKVDEKKIERYVSNIYTKGTFMTDNLLVYNTSNWICCIYSDDIDMNSCGISFLDVSSGIIKIYQYYHDILENIKRIIKIHFPSEIVFYKLETNTKLSNTYFSKFIDLTKVLLHEKYIENIHHHTKYKIELLSKVYPNTGLLNPIEYCNLEFYPEALNSFVRIIEFSYTQNEKIIEYLSKPEIILDENFLYLNSNLLDKLDILTLEKCLNKCLTSIGKREFKHRLLNPLHNLNEINNRLDLLDIVLNLDDRNYNLLEQNLKNIKDIQLLIRKIFINKDNYSMNTYILYQFYLSIDAILSLTYINDLKYSNNYYNLESLKNVCSKYIKIIDTFFDIRNYNTIQHCVIKDINFPINNNKIIIEIYNQINSLVSLNSEFNIELLNDKYYISFPNKKSLKKYVDDNNLICSYLKDNTNLQINLYPSDFEKTLSTKSSYKFYNRELNEYITYKVCKIKEYIKDHFYEFYSNINFDDIYHLIQFIQNIDITFCNAKNSKNLRYSKPQFNSTSTFEINDIRHPIIEIMNKSTKYIENDVSLNDGILLYGINSIGKSSLIKSVGLNCIMAQSGMHVSASNYNCMLIDKIFTRLPGSDDILNNNSSFTIEISDIRDILYNSTKNSLILGDEICQSTETYSGISIIATCLKMFSEKKCKFIISSHLHELTDLDEIKNIENMKIKHLTISQDTNKNLVFDRKLRDGPFHSLYGLEVCKSLGLPCDFIEFANSIRKKITNFKNISLMKTSKYNSNVIVKDFCQICSKKNANFHVHHIIEQQYADKDGYIGNIHKNDAFNLVTVCDKCHNDIHHNKIFIEGYKMTIDGIKLIFNCD